MTDNQKRILEMLSEKKISVDEAYRLLNVIESGESDDKGTIEAEPGSKHQPKYLRVVVQPNKEHEQAANVDRVNIRVPVSLIRAGMKLTSLIPSEAADKVNTALKDKGIEFDLRNIKTEDIEQLIEALSDLEVDVESGKEKVRVYVE